MAYDSALPGDLDVKLKFQDTEVNLFEPHKFVMVLINDKWLAELKPDAPPMLTYSRTNQAHVRGV